VIELRRTEDQGWRGHIAGFLSSAWDWIDERDIDKHTVSLLILWGTIDLTRWAKAYADLHTHTGVPGADIALVIAAVLAPYMALQAAALAFYFRART